MHIASLEIRNLRNIEQLQMEPAERVNWIIGGNGSGKTSFLESVFLLARGRTFRGLRHGGLVRRGSERLRIVGRLENDGNLGTVEMVGLGGRNMLYENGNRIYRVRDLKDRIQVRMLGENPQKLLEADPEVRRLFVDWNLFHVEHNYTDLLLAFRKVLSQRNAWLRSGGRGPRVWDDDYLGLSLRVTKARQEFVAALEGELRNLARMSRAFPNLSVFLSQGWPADRNLPDLIASSFAEDLKRGYTRYGPSRADLRIEADGVRRILSRGQTKVIVCLLQFAAHKVCQSKGCGTCIWLLDDLAGELDSKAFSTLWALFVGADGQVFATGLDTMPRPLVNSTLDGGRVFHVEQGALAL